MLSTFLRILLRVLGLLTLQPESLLVIFCIVGDIFGSCRWLALHAEPKTTAAACIWTGPSSSDFFCDHDIFFLFFSFLIHFPVHFSVHFHIFHSILCVISNASFCSFKKINQSISSSFQFYFGCIQFISLYLNSNITLFCAFTSLHYCKKLCAHGQWIFSMYFAQSIKVMQGFLGFRTLCLSYYPISLEPLLQ